MPFHLKRSAGWHVPECPRRAWFAGSFTPFVPQGRATQLSILSFQAPGILPTRRRLRIFQMDLRENGLLAFFGPPASGIHLAQNWRVHVFLGTLYRRARGIELFSQRSSPSIPV